MVASKMETSNKISLYLTFFRACLIILRLNLRNFYSLNMFLGGLKKVKCFISLENVSPQS